MTTFHFSYDLADISRSLGLLGFMAYVTNYLLLSFRILTSESILFFVINTTAATLVLISLTQDFNLASALIQSFWITIGLAAITIRVRLRLRDRRLAHIPVPLHSHDSHRERRDDHLHLVADRAVLSSI